LEAASAVLRAQPAPSGAGALAFAQTRTIGYLARYLLNQPRGSKRAYSSCNKARLLQRGWLSHLILMTPIFRLSRQVSRVFVVLRLGLHSPQPLKYVKVVSLILVVFFLLA